MRLDMLSFPTHTAASSMTGLTNPWHAEIFPWHAAFSAVLIFFNCFAQPASLYCKDYIHISDSGEIVYDLPLLPNDTVSEIFLQHLSTFSVTTNTQFKNNFITQQLVSTLNSGHHQAMIQEHECTQEINTRHSRITQHLVPSNTALSFVCCSQFACKKKVAHDFRYDPHHK